MPENQLPRDWSLHSVGEVVAQLTSGGTPESGNPRYYTDFGVPFAKIDDMSASDSRYLNSTNLKITEFAIRETAVKVYPVGTILVSMYGTIGLTKTTSCELAANQAIAALLPPFQCDPRYLAHYLLSQRNQLNRKATQTTQPNINARILRAFDVAVPPLPEQRLIAEILDTVDEAIRKTEAIIVKLGQVKQGLLHDLLTRGIDENGQLRDPDRHPEQFKDSRLGRIPKEWELEQLGELTVHVGSGITPRGGGEIYVSEGVLFIRSQNVHFEGLRLEDVAYIPQAVHESMSRSEVFPNDVLLNITGASIGRVCWLPRGLGPANVNQHVCAIRLPDPDVADAQYLSAVLGSPIGQRQISLLNAGGNREGLNYGQLRAFRIPWPRRPERVAIARSIEAFSARISAELVRAAKLRLLKQGLMDDLLIGRVRVTKLLQEAAT